MRTSLNKIRAIDDYLTGSLAPGESLVFEANMLLDTYLSADVQDQQETYALIRQYGRQKIKAEIMTVQETLTTAAQHRGFMQRIASLFKK